MRKTLFALLLLVALCVPVFAKRTTVRSYTRKNGTRVQSHQRTSPNRSKNDNWSTKGNVNPDTGKKGTKNP